MPIALAGPAIFEASNFPSGLGRVGVICLAIAAFSLMVARLRGRECIAAAQALQAVNPTGILRRCTESGRAQGHSSPSAPGT